MSNGIKEPGTEYVVDEDKLLKISHYDERDLAALQAIGNYDSFQILEAVNEDSIAFRKWFVDITGDLAAGVMLSQIHYWHGISKRDGKPRLKVEKEGHLWLCKSDNEWWKEARLTEKQARRAREILEKQGLIICKLWRFSNVPRIHMRINKPVFMSALNAAMCEKSRFALQGKSDLPQGANQTCPTGQNINRDYLTETTIEDPPTPDGDGVPLKEGQNGQSDRVYGITARTQLATSRGNGRPESSLAFPGEADGEEGGREPTIGPQAGGPGEDGEAADRSGGQHGGGAGSTGEQDRPGAEGGGGILRRRAEYHGEPGSRPGNGGAATRQANAQGSRPPAGQVGGNSVIHNLLSGTRTEGDDEARPKWQIPESPEQEAFLSVCSAKWFKPKQKSNIKGILAALRAGDMAGDDVYQKCAEAIADKGKLESPLPPLPRSWYEWREGHAKGHRWSVDGFVNALLDRDRLMEHCQYHLKTKGVVTNDYGADPWLENLPGG